MQYARKRGCGLKVSLRRPQSPAVQRLMADLKRLGYREPLPPRPLLYMAANDVAGFAAATDATIDAPLDLGGAQILAIGRYHGDHVVVRIPGHGDYRGRLFHDLFFAGSAMGNKGRLLFVGAFYLFCSFDCTNVQAAEALHEIRASRDTISDTSKSPQATARRNLVESVRRYLKTSQR